MRVKRYRDSDHKIVNSAVDKEDKALFRHCAGGKDKVSTRMFNSVVWPLLRTHGVDYLHITDQVKRLRKKPSENLAGHSYVDGICRFCGHSRKYAEFFKVKCRKTNKL